MVKAKDINLLVTSSFIVTTSKALVTRSDALVPSSFLLLVRMLLVAMPGAPNSFLLLLSFPLYLVFYVSFPRRKNKERPRAAPCCGLSSLMAAVAVICIT